MLHSKIALHRDNLVDSPYANHHQTEANMVDEHRMPTSGLYNHIFIVCGTILKGGLAILIKNYSEVSSTPWSHGQSILRVTTNE